VLQVDGSREAKVTEHGIENFFCSVFGFHKEQTSSKGLRGQPYAEKSSHRILAKSASCCFSSSLKS
jgi:hypothetical protein